jgi:hypothetical protein
MNNVEGNPKNMSRFESGNNHVEIEHMVNKIKESFKTINRNALSWVLFVM